MIRRLITILILAGCVLSAFAQSDIHRQILVFRKTGATEIFYADKIARIELSKYDTDSVEHEDFATHVFHRTDGTHMMIPLNDIDSVAFGSRQSIKPRNEVRRLTTEEAEAIARFSDTQLTYPKGTLSGLIVKPGETVYYDEMTEEMPYGLCARIKSVNSSAEGTTAEIEYLDPATVFDEYFISENDATVPGRAPSRVSDYDGRTFEVDLPKTSVAGIKVSGNVALRVQADLVDGVADFRHHYYHGLLRFHVGPHIKFGIWTEDSADDVDIETDPAASFRLPFLGGAVTLGVDVRSFLEIIAECGIEYDYKSGYMVEVEWTRRNGHDTFGQPTFTRTVAGEDAEQKIEVHLKGEIALGPSLEATVGILFNSLGAGTSLRVGPYVSGELSMGVIQQLSEQYDYESYLKGTLEMGMCLKLSTFTYRRDWWLIGDRVYNKLPFGAEIKIATGNLHLFPELSTRATHGRSQSNFVQTPETPRAIDVAAYTPTEIEYPLNIGFEVSDADTGESLVREINETDSVESNSTLRQNFSTEFPLVDELENIDPDKVKVSPVFRYKGEVIKARPANVADDMVFSPLIASLDGKGAYFVSGMTPVSQHDYEERTYVEGNILPMTDPDGKYRHTLAAGVVFVDLSANHSSDNGLTGTWHGTIDGDNVTIVFSDESNGEYNGVPFTYRTNSPRTGGISIRRTDGATITFYVTALSANSMEILSRDKKRSYTLTR